MSQTRSFHSHELVPEDKTAFLKTTNGKWNSWCSHSLVPSCLSKNKTTRILKPLRMQLLFSHSEKNSVPGDLGFPWSLYLKENFFIFLVFSEIPICRPWCHSVWACSGTECHGYRNTGQKKLLTSLLPGIREVKTGNQTYAFKGKQASGTHFLQLCSIA